MARGENQIEKYIDSQRFYITDMIIPPVENHLLSSDPKRNNDVHLKQGNIYAKIETNINQFAKIVNPE